MTIAFFLAVFVSILVNVDSVLGSPTKRKNKVGRDTSHLMQNKLPPDVPWLPGDMAEASNRSPEKILDELEEKDDFYVVKAMSTNKRIPLLSQTRIPRVFCNFNLQSVDRKEKARFTLQDAKPQYCSDFNYYHAEIQDYFLTSKSRLDIMPHSQNLYIPRYTALNDMKVSYPSLRTFLTVTESLAFTFLSIINDPDRNRMFVTSCVYNLRLWGFDGLMVKWLYPPQPSDLTRLLVDLRNAFEADFRRQKKGVPRLLLGVVVTGQTQVASSLYQVRAISNFVDFITLLFFDESPIYTTSTMMTASLYNPRGETPVVDPGPNTTTPTTVIPTSQQSAVPGPTTANVTYPVNAAGVISFHRSPKLLTEWASNNDKNGINDDDFDGGGSSSNDMHLESILDPFVDRNYIIDDTIEEWLRLGSYKSKLLVGLSLIGQGYTLRDNSRTDIGSPTYGPMTGKASTVPGQILFYEMCHLKQKGTLKRLSKKDDTPFWYSDEFWVSFEDIKSITQKVTYLRDSHILGMMLFSQSEDDFTGTHCGLGAFPASRKIYNISKLYLESFNPPSDQEWMSYCDASGVESKMPFWKKLLMIIIKYFIA